MKHSSANIHAPSGAIVDPTILVIVQITAVSLRPKMKILCIGCVTGDTCDEQSIDHFIF